jgi:hypothetical protein
VKHLFISALFRFCAVRGKAANRRSYHGYSVTTAPGHPEFEGEQTRTTTRSTCIQRHGFSLAHAVEACVPSHIFQTIADCNVNRNMSSHNNLVCPSGCYAKHLALSKPRRPCPVSLPVLHLQSSVSTLCVLARMKPGTFTSCQTPSNHRTSCA